VRQVTPGSVLRSVVVPLWLPVLLVLWWWFGSQGSTALLFPPLSEIIRSFTGTWLTGNGVSEHIVPSLRSLAIGLGIAIGGGLVLGVGLWALPRVRTWLAPLFHFFRSLPAPALIPGFIAFLGLGPRMEVAVIATGCIWPVLLNTMDGLAGTDPQRPETAQAYRLSPARTTLTVMLPSAAPQIFAGARTALQAGIILVVVSQMLGASEGIGFFIVHSQHLYRIPDMWSGMIALGIVGTVLNVLFVLVERRALRWFHGSREAQKAG
jgi:sulfonate transport system permease protein